MKNLKTISAIFTTLSLFFVMGLSQATTLTFEKITSNNDIDLTGQLLLDVEAVGTNGIEFTFYNKVGLDSSLTDVYFDFGSNSALFSSIGVSDDSDGLGVYDDVYFKDGAKTAVLPGANGSELSFTSDYDAGAKVKQGLDAGDEWVTFLAIIGDGTSYSDFMVGLLDGTYRIGAKLQSIGDAGPDNDSSTYMVSTVPIPAAGILFASALLVLGAFGRKKKKSANTLMVGAFTRAS